MKITRVNDDSWIICTDTVPVLYLWYYDGMTFRNKPCFYPSKKNAEIALHNCRLHDSGNNIKITLRSPYDTTYNN